MTNRKFLSYSLLTIVFAVCAYEYVTYLIDSTPVYGQSEKWVHGYIMPIAALIVAFAGYRQIMASCNEKTGRDGRVIRHRVKHNRLQRLFCRYLKEPVPSKSYQLILRDQTGQRGLVEADNFRIFNDYPRGSWFVWDEHFDRLQRYDVRKALW